MEIDLQDKPGAEVVEGLKRGPAADAPDQEEDAPPEGPGETGDPGAGDPPPLGVDPQEFDEAIGKLWVVGWSFLAKQMDEPELKEEKEMVAEAADALGPVARKHIPRQMQRFGPEAVAVSWVSGRIFSKMDHL